MTGIATEHAPHSSDIRDYGIYAHKESAMLVRIVTVDGTPYPLNPEDGSLVKELVEDAAFLEEVVNE